jgi:pimeloyl-ACP methyl ester carboxylesterase
VLSTPSKVDLAWHTIAIDGRRASYGIVGDPSHPTVAFLHGWALSSSTYRAGLERLVAAGYRVIAPALPGHNSSDALPGHPELGDYAAWVDALLGEIVDDEPVILIGHSLGGAVAIHTAHDYPARVRALVLIDSIGGSAWRRNGSIVETIRARPLWDWGIHFPTDILPSRQMRRVAPVIVQDAVVNALRNPRAVWHAANLARLADLTEELEELKRRELPVIVVWGARDRIVGKMSIDSLVDAVGTSHVHTVEGGHSWLLCDPEAFGEVMTNVLTVADQARHGEIGRA